MPVCSPNFLKQNPIRNAKDMSSISLLHLSSRPNAWKDWFALNNIVLSHNHGMLFEQFSIVIQAAVQVLVWRCCRYSLFKMNLIGVS